MAPLARSMAVCTPPTRSASRSDRADRAGHRVVPLRAAERSGSAGRPAFISAHARTAPAVRRAAQLGQLEQVFLGTGGQGLGLAR